MTCHNKASRLASSFLLLTAALCFLIAAFFLAGSGEYLPEDVPVIGRFFESEKMPSDSEMTLTVIDVGQASCSLLQSGSSAVLIDCGDSASSGAILNTLEKYKVEKLDLMIITHLHADHYGSAADIIEKVEVGKVIIPKTPKTLIPTTVSFEKLLDAIESSKSELILCDEASSIELRNETVISFLDGFLDEPDNLNNTSLTLRIDFKDASFLITGDAETEIEEKLIGNGQNINADILIVGHHGSATSSSRHFLNALTPSASVISVGKNNSYNLPKDNVIRRLAAFGPIYRTDINGTVTFSTDGVTINADCDNISDSFAA